MTALVIFSDAGIDDVMAIHHLLEHRKVTAIIATVGNGSAERAYDVLSYFFGERVAVYLGSAKGNEAHKIHQALEILAIPTVNNRNLLKDNIEKIFSDSVIVSIAPLTDLANIIGNGYSIKEIVIMGGAYHVAGNDSISAEYNFLQDAFAAKKVIGDIVKKTIVPLDVTNKLRFRQNHIDYVNNTEMKQLLEGLLDHYQSLGDDSFPLHDLTAALYVTNPEAFTLKPRYCDVSTGRDAQGAIIVDEHRYQRKAANANLISDLDIPPLHYVFIQTARYVNHKIGLSYLDIMS